VTVDLHFLTRQVEFGFEYLLITITSNLPPNATNINNLAIRQGHFTDQLPLIMNDLSLPDNPDTILTLLALELDPQLKLFSLMGVEEVHVHFGAAALYVEQQLLDDQVGTVQHDQGVDCDLVVEVLVFWSFVSVELEFVVVAVLLDQLLVWLLFGYFGVLDDSRLEWRRVLRYFLFFLLVLSRLLLLFCILFLLLYFLYLLLLLFLSLSKLLFLRLNFLFQLYFFKMLIFQPELHRLIVLLKTVLHPLQRLKNVMCLMVFAQKIYKLPSVRFRHRLIQNLKARSRLWIKLLVNLQLNHIFLQHKMQVHLLVKQQRSYVDKIYFWLIFLLQPKRILIPPDYLVVLLLLVRQFFQQLQKRFLLEVLFVDLLDLLLYLWRLAVVRKAFGVLLEELQLVSARFLQLL
jgi:hypothetical protein